MMTKIHFNTSKEALKRAILSKDTQFNFNKQPDQLRAKIDFKGSGNKNFKAFIY